MGSWTYNLLPAVEFPYPERSGKVAFASLGRQSGRRLGSALLQNWMPSPWTPCALSSCCEMVLMSHFCPSFWFLFCSVALLPFCGKKK